MRTAPRTCCPPRAKPLVIPIVPPATAPCCPIPGVTTAEETHATFEDTIAPFVVTLQTPDAGFGPDGPDAFFFETDASGGTLEIAVPGTDVSPLTHRYCFCATWRQETTIVSDSISAVGVGSVLAGQFFGVAFIPPSPNYQLVSTGGGSFDTGVPRDGLEHAWRVCVDGLSVSFSVDGGPLTPALGVTPPGVPLPPFVFVNQAEDTTPNRIRVSDYCLSRVPV